MGLIQNQWVQDGARTYFVLYTKTAPFFQLLADVLITLVALTLKSDYLFIYSNSAGTPYVIYKPCSNNNIYFVYVLTLTRKELLSLKRMFMLCLNTVTYNVYWGSGTFGQIV